MKAMVFAAGLGTRLRPLTNDRPKALVEIAGRSLLQLALERLRTFGIQDVIINVHHFADQIVDYLRTNDHFGMRIEISREDVLLDTGGGLKKAAWFFRGDAEPFVVHNVDVVSTIDLQRMIEFHVQQDALATLAVKSRETSRPLLFDDALQLCGRRLIREEKTEVVRPSGRLSELAFSGIHVVSPRLLDMLEEDGVFSIIPVYLRLAGAGKKIMGFPADEYHWRDLGRVEDLKKAELELGFR